MRAHIVSDGVVVNTIIIDSLDDFPDALDADLLGGGIGWLWDGRTLMPPPGPQKTPQEIRIEITTAVQERLDIFAQTRGYDNIVSACSYATSNHSRYGPEGRYCVQVREATWDKLFEIESEVLAGTRPMPRTYAEIEPELPVLAWPA